ncbi:MAG: protein-disulfide reductase DsbD N-terminal domain-containing protein [Pyrinomonadaceae bacterium]|nr:protein-disulfide reductase DsbD N-terminal domain-containing protein [Acidobacteriota bacterium]
MSRIHFALIICSLALVLPACSQQQQTTSDLPANQAHAVSSDSSEAAKIPLSEVVRVSVAPVALKAGGAGEAAVRLAIADGYHINANPPTYPYLKATEIEIAPEAGVTASKPTYPPALTKKFAFAEDQLAVYESEALINVPLRASNNASAGARTLRAKIRVQACDEEKCFPPQNLETTIPLTIN